MTSVARSPRKFQASRAIKCEPNAQSSTEMVVQNTPWSASMSNVDGGSRTEVYALVNDRYPGAPGTALAKAEEAEERAKMTKKREQVRKKAANAELEHLGVKNLTKRRRSSSSYASSSPSESGSSVNGDTEEKSFRSGSRHRRASSRNSSPMPLTTEATRLPHHITNAPVHPSPLATHAIAAHDVR